VTTAKEFGYEALRICEEICRISHVEKLEKQAWDNLDLIKIDEGKLISQGKPMFPKFIIRQQSPESVGRLRPYNPLKLKVPCTSLPVGLAKQEMETRLVTVK
jgi:hypothetical protein